jgi:hypothetical protein
MKVIGKKYTYFFVKKYNEKHSGGQTIRMESVADVISWASFIESKGEKVRYVGYQDEHYGNEVYRHFIYVMDVNTD